MSESITAKDRMRELEAEVRKHQDLYYVKHAPSISDRAFDRLYAELQQLERDYPEFASPDSPTRSVGSDLDNDFPKFTHTIPVLSLGNTYSTAEALAWARKHLQNDQEVVDIQWKVDGATLVLYYERGVLKRAVTRGSGQVGDDVTANALTIQNVPRKLKKPETLVARGEVYMTYADFESFNETMGGVYANPRNLSAGSLKHKKSREVARRPLRWAAFDASFPEKKGRARPKSDRVRLELLRELGVPLFPDNAFVPGTELEQTIQDFEKRRDDMPMPVDGLVLKIDDLDRREILGATANTPRWATALKFEPEVAETRVLEIEVAVGRTGRVTPRARLESVQLAGTTVSYATLHNADQIGRLGVRVGSFVRVSKRGEIIPAVEEVIEVGDGPEFVYPDKCPSCATTLVREPEAVDWLCPNPECPDVLLNRLIFFCQRKQMDIAGMGEKICRILFERGFVRRLPDIYSLHKHREELESLDGFGQKSVRILLDGIQTSLERPFRRVLPSLGLRELGPFVTDVLLRNGYHSIQSIQKLVKKKGARDILEKIDGIGPRTSQAIVDQFRDPGVLELIKDLKKAGLQFEETAPAQDNNQYPQIFSGQTWCVTGSFESFHPRELAMEEVQKRGGRTVSGISGKTTHLLAGEGAGSKLKKAQELGVQVVDEPEFLKLLKKKK